MFPWVVILPYLAIVGVIIIIAILFEYRVKKPDQIILFEKNGKIGISSHLIYPRHFRLALPRTTETNILDVKSEAKGKIVLKVSLAVTVAPSVENIQALITVGGWKKDATKKAGKELAYLLQSTVKEFTEKYEVEELTLEKVSEYVKKNLGSSAIDLGLDIISISVQAVEPIDEHIAELLRKREAERIRELNELMEQKARINAAKSKAEADEEIYNFEHTLELKRIAQKRLEEEKDAELTLYRVNEELKRRELQLQFDKKEIALLKENPELLILSPQIARLAQASQKLPNAKTIVSLSPGDIAQGTELIDTVKSFLENMVKGGIAKKTDKTTES